MTTNAKELFESLDKTQINSNKAITLQTLQDFERSVRVDGIKEALSIIMSAHHEQITSVRDRIKELESQQPT